MELNKNDYLSQLTEEILNKVRFNLEGVQEEKTNVNIEVLEELYYDLSYLLLVTKNEDYEELD